MSYKSIPWWLILLICCSILLFVIDDIEWYAQYFNPGMFINLDEEGTVTWITTREGLTSRWFQVEIMHSHAVANGKTLRVVDNNCGHYPDIDRLRMCDIFVLPPTVTCTHIPPDLVVQN